MSLHLKAATRHFSTSCNKNLDLAITWIWFGSEWKIKATDCDNIFHHLPSWNLLIFQQSCVLGWHRSSQDHIWRQNFRRWSAAVWLDGTAVFIRQRSGRRLTFTVLTSWCLEHISLDTKNEITHTHTELFCYCYGVWKNNVNFLLDLVDEHLLRVDFCDEWMSEDFTGSDPPAWMNCQHGLQELNTLLSLSLQPHCS